MYNPTKPYKHKILRLIESTWHSPHIVVTKGLYPIFKKKFSFPEVHHTDGIGTKGFYHWRKRSFKNAVIDALAMNLNDLAMVKATPYALQNHIILPKDDHQAIVAIVSVLADECRKRNIAMTGGETSIHTDSPGMDVSITVSGFIKNTPKNQCEVGDVLIGLKSNGLHANGITKIREVLPNKTNKEFTKPTKIYFEDVTALHSKYKINGMMHITGGAFSKLKDILVGADAIITQPKKIQPQPIFHVIREKGHVSDTTMYTTFNCGIGFVLSVPKHDASNIVARLSNAAIIGKVVSGTGKVHITSAFTGKNITL